MIEEKLKRLIADACVALGITEVPFALEHPAEIAHGDWATNVAMAAAKRLGKNPRTLAEEIAEKLRGYGDPDIIAVEVAGPGFINFRLSEASFARALEAIALAGESWGSNNTLEGKKVIVEYTDPNPFKEFHIGHLMSNAIGESIARLIEASKAETKRACYQGDVGLHVAKAVWGKRADSSLSWAEAYVKGANAGDETKREIQELNKKIYERSDAEVNALYDAGRTETLAYFETMYSRLGTRFDEYFFESATGEFGRTIVEAHKGDVFDVSDGAVVFHAERDDPKLHTRVFINNEGLPTYEAKELGLAQMKYERFAYDISIVITGNEVNDYFQVLLAAMRRIFPDLAAKTEHYSHGMLRLPTGKMSSRTGDVITAATLLDEAKGRIAARVEGVSEVVAEAAAVAAVKYAVLRQAAGKDIIFDFDQSLSFEGDSGPYLQYTHARTCSLLEKGKGKSGEVKAGIAPVLERLLVRFPEIVLRAAREREPHYVANYLITIAREFTSFYGNTTILDGGAREPAKLALVAAVNRTLARGLYLLGMPAPTTM